MRLALVAALALSLIGCESRKSAPAPGPAPAASTARAPLVDLTTSSSLAAVRAVFNAHRGEPRFLTLLSPT